MQDRRRQGIFLALFTVLFCLVYFVWEQRPERGVEPVLRVESETPDMEAELFGGLEEAGRSTRDLVELGEGSVEQGNPEAALAEARGFLLKGRCVRGDTGDPLAGCDVRIRRERAATDRGAPWQDLEPVGSMVTGLDGLFEVQVSTESGARRTALRLSRDGFAPRWADWKRPKAGDVIDVGDIAMDRAVQVTGQVTYPDGGRVADVGILFANVALTGQVLVEPERMLRTRTDDAGRFRLDSPAFFGEWYPRVEGSGAMLEPQMVLLGEAESPDYHIHITVEKPDPQYSISGMCVGEAGEGLPGITLSASGDGFRGVGRSRMDGTFEIPRGGPNPVRGPVSVSASDDQEAYEQVLPESGTEFSWGDKDVLCVLRRRPTQSVQVVDARGESVEDFSLFTFSGRYGGWTRMSELCFHGKHADGRVRLTGLLSGKCAVLVVPNAPGLGPSDLTSFDLDGAVPSTEFVVTVPDLVTLRVELSDASGQPCQGSRVELLTGIRGFKPKLDSHAVDIADCDLGASTPDFARHGMGTSGPSGRVEIQTTPGTRYLRITGSTHIPIVKRVEVEGPLTVLPITLQTGCTLSGTVGPETALQSLALLSPDGENPVQIELRLRGKATPIQAMVETDGTFAVGGLKPGKYTVSLHYWMRSSTVTEGWIQVPIHEVDLVENEPSHVDIDAQPHLPGHLSGHIQVNGKPLAGKHCFARRSAPDPFRMLRFSTDAEGHFEALVPPGTYSYSITLEAQPGPGWIMMTLPESLDLDPGSQHQSNHNVELRTIRIHLLDEWGAPLANQPIALKSDSFHSPGAKQTDANGWVTLDPAPLDEFQITTTIEDEKLTLGPVDLPPGQTEGDVTLRIGDVR